MARRRSLFASLLFVYVVAASSLGAYPIPPVALRDLVAGSDLVVVAWVESVSTAPPGAERPWEDAVAHLAVLETLKGPYLAGVEVPYPAGLLCPAPPRYDVGETVLVFLQSGDRLADERRCTSYEDDCARLEGMRGKWFTNSLSYGTLYPSSTDLSVFRARIAEAVTLDERARGPQAEREWLLRCAEHAATRWHGLYPLAAAGDRAHFFYDRTGNAIEPLTKAEKTRLADAFVKEPSLDATLPMVLEALSDVTRDDVDRVASSALETLFARKSLPYQVFDVAPLVAARWARSPVRLSLCEVAKEAGDGDAAEESVEGSPVLAFFEGRCSADDVRQAWANAKRMYSIPDIPALDVGESRRRPVGPSTPD